MALPQLAFKFSNQILSNFETLIATCQQISSTFSWPDCHVSIASSILYSAGTFLAVTAPAWILLLYTKMKKNKIDNDRLIVDPIDFQGGEVNVEPQPDSFTDGNNCEIVAANAQYKDHSIASDAEYAEQIQLQESLMASILTSNISNTPSSSLHSSQVLCKICLENKPIHEMFKHDNCPHTFCHACTTLHIMSKIQDRVNPITCPSPNCTITLNHTTCRHIIPNDALVKWDEILCLSLIPESHKLYCPFHDCSSMLVNDTDEVVRKVKCVACKRLFCAQCRVPWHSEFACKEFQKVYARKGGKDDKILKSLAKKKRWQKCPKCKVYVEKTEGCVHMTCRCMYEFCYRCGSKWSDSNCSKCKWVHWIAR